MMGIDARLVLIEPGARGYTMVEHVGLRWQEGDRMQMLCRNVPRPSYQHFDRYLTPASPHTGMKVFRKPLYHSAPLSLSTGYTN